MSTPTSTPTGTATAATSTCTSPQDFAMPSMSSAFSLSPKSQSKGQSTEKMDDEDKENMGLDYSNPTPTKSQYTDASGLGCHKGSMPSSSTNANANMEAEARDVLDDWVDLDLYGLEGKGVRLYPKPPAVYNGASSSFASAAASPLRDLGSTLATNLGHMIDYHTNEKDNYLYGVSASTSSLPEQISLDPSTLADPFWCFINNETHAYAESRLKDADRVDKLHTWLCRGVDWEWREKQEQREREMRRLWRLWKRGRGREEDDGEEEEGLEEGEDEEDGIYGYLYVPNSIHRACSVDIGIEPRLLLLDEV